MELNKNPATRRQEILEKARQISNLDDLGKPRNIWLSATYRILETISEHDDRSTREEVIRSCPHDYKLINRTINYMNEAGIISSLGEGLIRRRDTRVSHIVYSITSVGKDFYQELRRIMGPLWE
mgnify:CR=1 FL=1